MNTTLTNKQIQSEGREEQTFRQLILIVEIQKLDFPLNRCSKQTLMQIHEKNNNNKNTQYTNTHAYIENERDYF